MHPNKQSLMKCYRLWIVLLSFLLLGQAIFALPLKHSKVQKKSTHVAPLPEDQSELDKFSNQLYSKYLSTPFDTLATENQYWLGQWKSLQEQIIHAKLPEFEKLIQLSFSDIFVLQWALQFHALTIEQMKAIVKLNERRIEKLKQRKNKSASLISQVYQLKALFLYLSNCITPQDGLLSYWDIYFNAYKAIQWDKNQWNAWIFYIYILGLNYDSFYQRAFLLKKWCIIEQQINRMKHDNRPIVTWQKYLLSCFLANLAACIDYNTLAWKNLQQAITIFPQGVLVQNLKNLMHHHLCWKDIHG